MNFSLTNKISQLKNLSWYLLASIISALIGVLFNPFLAKNLSPLDYSIIGYYGSFSGLFTPILNFSVISYYVKSYFTIPEKKREAVCDTVSCVLVLWGVVSSILILIGFYFFCRTRNVIFPFLPYAFLTIVQLFFNNFALLYQVNCRMKREANKYFWVVMIASLSTVVLSIILVIIFKLGAVGRMSSGAISALFIALYSYKKTTKHLTLDKTILKDAISFGWPISVASIIQFFLVGIDMVIVEPLGDTYTMGLYVVGCSLGSYLSMFYMALAQTVEPDMYEAVAKFNYMKLKKIILLITAILFLIVLVFYIFAKPFTYILTFGKYTAAYRFAQIMAFSTITTYLMSTIKTIMNAFDYTKQCLYNQIAVSIMGILIYITMRNHFGFYGVATAKVFIPLLVFIIGVIQLKYLLHGKTNLN